MFSTMESLDLFLRSTYGDWFRFSCVESFDISRDDDQSYRVSAKLKSGDQFSIGPAGHESAEKARKWLAEFVQSLCDGNKST